MKKLKLSIDTSALDLLARVSHFLAERGIQSHLTGGFIRDVLLERDTADIDIALAANALEVAPEMATTLGGKYVLLDTVNKVGRVIVANRKTPSARGRWQIDLSTVKDAIEHDLARRDFTINAIAVDLEELGKGTDVPLMDPFHGRDDLQLGIIRVVAETAFTSDAVRLLRALRLAGELGFRIDNETELLIQRDHQLITTVAAERIREELLRLLELPQSGKLLRYLDRLELLCTIIPELAPLKAVKQPKEHFWDVFDHSLETVAAVDFILRQGTAEYATEQVLAVVPWSEELAEHFAREVIGGGTRRALLKLAALLHDTAKPQTRAFDDSGRLRFLGHAPQGAAIAVDILERLRFSTREVKRVETMVRHHLRPGQLSQEEQLPTHRAIYRYFRDTADAGIDTLFLNLADHLAARGPQLDLVTWQEHAQMVDYILAQHQRQQSVITPARLIDGHDLINIFGLSPGPGIGQFLESVREAQAADEVSTREEALVYIRKRLSLPNSHPEETEDK